MNFLQVKLATKVVTVLLLARTLVCLHKYECFNYWNCEKKHELLKCNDLKNRPRNRPKIHYAFTNYEKDLKKNLIEHLTFIK